MCGFGIAPPSISTLNWYGTLQLISHAFHCRETSKVDLVSAGQEPPQIPAKDYRLSFRVLFAATQKVSENVLFASQMGVSIVMMVPQNGWFIRENPNLKWMLGGYPYFRNHPNK